MMRVASTVVNGKEVDYPCLKQRKTNTRQPNMDPKFLVVVICSTRSHAVVWDSFKRNVLDTLPGADLALAVSKTGGAKATARKVDNELGGQHFDLRSVSLSEGGSVQNRTGAQSADGQKPTVDGTHDEYREHAKFIWDVDDPPNNDYTELYNKIAKKCGNNMFWARELVSYFPGNVFSGIGGGDMNAGSGAMLYFFRYVALQEILRQSLDREYTHVVITRSDYEYTAPHPTRMDTRSLWIPQGEDYGGVTDRHTVIPMGLAVPALNIVEESVTRTGSELMEHLGVKHRVLDLNPEGYLKMYYEANGLKLTRFPRIMFSVRDTNDGQASTWAKGEAIEGFASNVLVKYRTEYSDSLATAYALSACASGCTSVDSCAWTTLQSPEKCRSLGCSDCVAKQHRCTTEYSGFNTGTAHFSVPSLTRPATQLYCGQTAVSSLAAIASEVSSAARGVLATDHVPSVVTEGMRESGAGAAHA